MTELNCDYETTFDLHLFPTITRVDLAIYFRKYPVFEQYRLLLRLLKTELDWDYDTVRLIQCWFTSAD